MLWLFIVGCVVWLAGCTHTDEKSWAIEEYERQVMLRDAAEAAKNAKLDLIHDRIIVL